LKLYSNVLIHLNDRIQMTKLTRGWSGPKVERRHTDPCRR